MPDNYSMWESHERRLERELARRPVCSFCEEPIQESYMYEINGEVICPNCMETYFRKEVEDGFF